MSRLTKKENVDFTTNVIIHTVGFTVIGSIKDRNYNNALKKLYELENIFEWIEEIHKKQVWWKDYYGNIFYDDYTQDTILYNPKTNEIVIYAYEFLASYKVEEYGKTWAFTEEELKDKE